MSALTAIALLLDIILVPVISSTITEPNTVAQFPDTSNREVPNIIDPYIVPTRNPSPSSESFDNNTDFISSNEIISRAGKGIPVEIDHMSIKGDLNLNGSKVSSPIYITESSILGTVECNDVSFLAPIDFSGTKFTKNVEFDRSQFADTALFKNANFSEDTEFRDSSFHKEADFSNTRFNKSVDFADSTFNTIHFVGSNFSGNAVFNGSQFNGESDFSQCLFEGESDFAWSNFNRNANFKGSNFSRNVDMSGSIFRGEGDFVGAAFNDKLVFNNSEFSTFRIPWSSIKDRLVFDGMTYFRLIKNYNNLLWYEDANNCYYEYRNQSFNIMPPFSSEKLFDRLIRVTTGYGLNLKNAAAIAICIILLFGLFFWKGNGAVEHKPCRGARISLIDSIRFSLILFCPAKIPNDFRAVGKYRDLAVAENLLGWVYLSVIIASLLQRAIFTIN